MHFQRKNLFANYESEGPAETIVSRLEALSSSAVQMPEELYETLISLAK
jgi:hypothetical protein